MEDFTEVSSTVKPDDDNLDLRPTLMNVRPQSRTVRVLEGEFVQGVRREVGLTLDRVIADELADYERGLEACLGRGAAKDEAEYAASTPDLALWEGGRCLAVIKPSPEGDPDVIRLDGEAAWTIPEPRGHVNTFVVVHACSDEEQNYSDVYSGHGMTLDDVYAHMNECFHGSLEDWKKGGEDVAREVEAHPELIILKGNRVVAFFTPSVSGDLVVSRPGVPRETTTPGSARVARPAFRSFAVFAPGTELDHYSGPGMTLAKVVAEEESHYRVGFEACVGPGKEDRGDYARDHHDLVVYEGTKVVAVLCARIDGKLHVHMVKDEKIVP